MNSLTTQERISVTTGIASLDRILDGGFNRGDTILVAGQPGSGKTTLALQFLRAGIERGEPGVYATFVESASKLRRDASLLSQDLEPLEASGKLSLLDLLQTVGEKGVSANFEDIRQEVARINATHLVIDSLSAMTTYINSTREARSFLALMNRVFETLECTTLLLLEVPWGQTRIGAGFEEFLSDGLVVLESSMESFRVTRRLYVPKMRGVNHKLECYEFYITSEGIAISPLPMVTRDENSRH